MPSRSLLTFDLTTILLSGLAMTTATAASLCDPLKTSVPNINFVEGPGSFKVDSGPPKTAPVCFFPNGGPCPTPEQAGTLLQVVQKPSLEARGIQADFLTALSQAPEVQELLEAMTKLTAEAQAFFCESGKCTAGSCEATQRDPAQVLDFSVMEDIAKRGLEGLEKSLEKTTTEKSGGTSAQPAGLVSAAVAGCLLAWTL